MSNKVTTILADNRKFEITNIVIIFIFGFFSFSLLLASTIYYAYTINTSFTSNMLFIFFFLLLNMSTLMFLVFFFIYVLNHGPTLLNFYHKKINKQIKSGEWKNDPDQKKHFYKKFRPYIKLVIKMQIRMNLFALASIILLLISFILLDVIYSIPQNIIFNNAFCIFTIISFVIILAISIYYHIFKILTNKRYLNKNWNYSIIYSFILSNLNRQLHKLANENVDLSNAKKFYINIKSKFFDVEKNSKNNLDWRFERLKNWTKIWVSPLLVLLWSLFIVFIPTIVIWWLDVAKNQESYNVNLVLCFSVILILSFYYFVSVCLFYFFIFNNFQLHKNESEDDSKKLIKKIIFIPEGIKKHHKTQEDKRRSSNIYNIKFSSKLVIDSDEIINMFVEINNSGNNTYKKEDLDTLLSKTKLFFMLGILKKVFQNYDFDKPEKQNLVILIRDKIYDLTYYDQVYKDLYLKKSDGTYNFKQTQNKVKLEMYFTKNKDFIVKYKFDHWNDPAW